MIFKIGNRIRGRIMRQRGMTKRGSRQFARILACS